jgi:diguanylate cyclase (GGDEF)-like protein
MTSAPGVAAEPAALRWLRGDASDRARFADMVRQFQHAEAYTAGLVVALVCLLSAWWYGAPQLFLVVVGGLTLLLSRLGHGRTRRPELLAVSAFTALELNLAVGVLLSGGGTSALLPLMAVPVFSQAVCLRRPVFLAGAVASAVLAVLAVLLAPLLPAVTAAPPPVHLFSYVALLAALAMAGNSVLSSELTARDEAVMDPMTGLYNRLTLSDRFTEAQGTGGWVGLVMCDIDHFKAINDSYGHDRGDQVLSEIADRLRANLRSSDVAYRVGGEEFVVLLPGRDSAAAERVAERIRRSVESAPLAGLPVTLSAGVVCTQAESHTLAEVLREADAALYAAKKAGRNRVVTGVTDDCPPRPQTLTAGPDLRSGS